MSTFARVAVPRPLYRTFLYRVPDSLAGDVRPGSRVVVPFGPRELTGWVDELVADPDDVSSKTRPILDAPDPEPVLGDELLELARWVARYYVAPLGLALRATLPAPLTSESSERLVRLRSAPGAPSGHAERALLAHLDEYAGPLKLGSVRKALGPGPWAGTARKLAELGFIEILYDAPSVAPPVRARQVVRLTRELASLSERDRIFARARRQRELYEYLESAGGDAEIAHLGRRLGISRSVVQGLVTKELAEIREEAVLPNPPPFPELESAPPHPYTPTDAQASGIRQLLAAADRQPPGTFVLKGVTGSGKTLVYIEVLKELVGRRGRGAILLVPEISLTPQTVGRFRAAFGDDVALLHSALSDGERYAAWDAARTGKKRIVIGARSAVFAPVRKLGAIIIDEEHEGSYKQSDPAPRYHAREVAVIRAARAGALCLLGSATPSLEAWSNARSGTWQLLELPERIGPRPLPKVAVVDLRAERRERANGKPPPIAPLVLSTPLEGAIRDRLDRREQTILLLNRRGYATFVQCRECGAVCDCSRCNVSLTHHRRPPRLVCHHCYHQEPVPNTCAECGSTGLSHRGVGTEQVEQVLGESYPSARIARMDVDTTSAKWSHHEILARFERGMVDILFGTQMIAKGLDFPRVTLVGVINADVGLGLPDFRASERTFQLLTQVAGRAGRGPAGGEVIVQTSLPGHYAITHAITHDYDSFASREFEERRGPMYPPHVRLANLVLSGTRETAVQEAGEAASAWILGLLRAREIEAIDAVGPAPCPIDRIRNRWRWHLLLKSRDGAALGAVLAYFARRFKAPGRAGGDLRVEIDRDPVSLL